MRQKCSSRKLLKMQIQHFERLLKLLYQKKKTKVFKHAKKKMLRNILQGQITNLLRKSFKRICPHFIHSDFRSWMTTDRFHKYTTRRFSKRVSAKSTCEISAVLSRINLSVCLCVLQKSSPEEKVKETQLGPEFLQQDSRI